MVAGRLLASKATLGAMFADGVGLDEYATSLLRAGDLGAEKFIRVLYDDLARAIRQLEEGAAKNGEDGEERLTDTIAIQLRAMGYRAECEPDKRGHVDLHVECSQLDLTWKGEAKIHTSYVKNHDGLRQLMDRYSSGRDAHAGFLLYVKKPGLAKILSTWKGRLQSEKMCGFERFGGDFDRHGFESVHEHTSGFPLHVRHFPVFLHYEPTDPSAVNAKKKATKKKAAKKKAAKKKAAKEKAAKKKAAKKSARGG